jgi:hypothetical protein
MITRFQTVFLVVFLVAGLIAPGFVGAENSRKDAVATGAQVFTGRAEYHNVRMCLDYVVDAMASLDLKYNDARISPIVMSEQWHEFPIELGWMGTQDTLVPLFEKLQAYSFGESRLAHGALSISCTAETLDDGQPLLSMTSQVKLMCFGGAEKDRKENPAEFWPVFTKRNQQVLRALKSLRQITTFTPQVSKKSLGGRVGPGKTWITNFRLDYDNRIQITGYGLDAKQVTQLGEELLKSGSYVEVFLTSMNKNVYEKVPVWRFDMCARIH